MIYNKTTIMESDSESPIVMTIVIGNNILDELLLCLVEEDYESETTAALDVEYTAKYVAVIDKDSLAVMAEKLNIELVKMRDHLIDKFSEGCYISNKSYVMNAYRNILDYVLDCGGKYRLKQN